MRLDKLTTKFQEALSDAQTIALGSDHGFIEPGHLLVAMLKQEEGPRSLLMRAGVNINGLLKDCEEAIKNFPQVQGQEQVQVSRDLVTLLQAAEKDALKRGDQYVAGELFLLAFSESKSELANKARAHGLNKASLYANDKTKLPGNKAHKTMARLATETPNHERASNPTRTMNPAPSMKLRNKAAKVSPPGRTASITRTRYG